MTLSVPVMVQCILVHKVICLLREIRVIKIAKVVTKIKLILVNLIVRKKVVNVLCHDVVIFDLIVMMVLQLRLLRLKPTLKMLQCSMAGLNVNS